MALSKKLALVQVPPGTGKTFVGIQLVKALISNTCGNAKTDSLRDAADAAPPLLDMPSNPYSPCVGPILIVCFTNHALDQFLEQLVAVGLTDLVRVGGR